MLIVWSPAHVARGQCDEEAPGCGLLGEVEEFLGRVESVVGETPVAMALGTPNNFRTPGSPC